ncbi:hypothetical protein D3C81_2168760 [compost metagenome]
MSQHNASYFVAVLCKVGNIRNDDVDAKHVLFRKFQTGIHHDNVIAVLNDIHIFPDFTDAAQSENHQFIVVIFFRQMNLNLLW